MSEPLRLYSFPPLHDLLLPPQQAHRETPATAEPPAVAEAVRRGFQEGLERGRGAAQAELTQLAAAVRAQGIEQGHGEGLAEAAEALAALKDALTQLEQEAKAQREQVEQFALEIALAAAARLIEIDRVRAEFITRLVRLAQSALAPQAPTLIRINPADQTLLGKALADLPVAPDATLAPGHAVVEAGPVFVEGGIDEAFEQIKGALLAVAPRRPRPAGSRRQ